ncbi:MAG: hypothetical protein D6707_00535 [Bacteroidetes bacterium]|nr:MAG: hypothetical protein D6707_00535 [Bacteroidota bacterium]
MFFYQGSFAQLNDFKYKEVVKYHLPEGENYLIIPSDFAHEELKEISQKVSVKLIESVSLVYTKYCFNPAFNQQALNEKRWENLQEIIPQLSAQAFYVKYLIAQTGCGDTVLCKEFFHGFVIKFRQPSSVVQAEKEIEEIDRFFAKSRRASSSFDLVQRWDDKTGYYYDTIYREGEPSGKHAILRDTLLLNLLRQMDKDNYLLVVDVTGSMAPYTAQTLKWVEQYANSKKIALITFFNDGDNAPSPAKRIGETGGIYFTENKDMIKILRVMRTAMRKGQGGGEDEENDVEAILKGLEECTKCEQVILIADNFERFRDEMLLNQINKPVYIVVAGADEQINPYYLQLQEKYSNVKVLY